MDEVTKKRKKCMKFKVISLSNSFLGAVLLLPQIVFTIWLPPPFFENPPSLSLKKEPDITVAAVDIGKTHFVVGADRHSNEELPVFRTNPHSEVPVFDGLPLNCEGHLCTVLFEGFYDTLEILVAKEKKSILVAAYMLTDKRIVQWLCEAHKRGVRVEVVTDMSCLRERFNKLGELYECGIPIFICMADKKAKSSLMHNKFILFESNIYGRKIVWTGSANLTRSAFNELHHENVVILDDVPAYHEYQKRFSYLKKQSERYEECTITNAALHEKVRISNNTLKNNISEKKKRKAFERT